MISIVLLVPSLSHCMLCYCIQNWS